MAKKAAPKTTPKAAPKAKADEGGEELGTALVAMPKSTALSTEVGMIALNHLTALATDEQMIDELRSGKESHRGKAQVLLAIAATRPVLRIVQSTWLMLLPATSRRRAFSVSKFVWPSA